eukprot:891142-Pleurochrysis_carterae.AAC.1
MGTVELEGQTTRLYGAAARGPRSVTNRICLLSLFCGLPPLILLLILLNRAWLSHVAQQWSRGGQGSDWAEEEQASAWLVSESASAIYEKSNGGLLEMRHGSLPVVHGVLWDETTQSPIK